MTKSNNPKRLIGRFYFKKTQNDNLIGEFSNNKENRVYTESSDLLSRQKESIGYEGEYETTWRQSGQAFIYTLKISIKPNTNAKIYELTWFENNSPIFIGEGFANDNTLIGDYREPD